MFTSSPVMRILSISIAAAALALAAASPAAQAPTGFQPLAMRVPFPPSPLIASGRAHLAYEVHITNMASRAVMIDTVEVRNVSAPGAAPLLRLENETLRASLRKFGAPPDDPDIASLAAGQSSVLFVWLTGSTRDVPRSLTHRIGLRIPGAPDPVMVNGLDLAVSSRPPRIVGPPLEGGHSLAANGPDNGALHRRTILSLSGEPRIAQRYAIDWVQLYEDGRTFRGDARINSSYRAFGANVLAVADGMVVSALDEIPENVPDLTARAVPMTPQTLVGNNVVLELGGGAWAVYSHLQLGSVQVRRGDRVRRGQVLGRVGNTGNSTEPHLHFHISDRNHAIDSEGIPYGHTDFVLEAEGAEVTGAFREVGQSVEIERATLDAWFARPSQNRQSEIRS